MPPLPPEEYMRRAFTLALTARGRTRPNPLVGAVVVREGQVVGEGYHARAGAPHAEVMALQAAGEEARGATLYVNLEPCCHYGRTPPCTEAVVQSGITDVYVAIPDPNPQVGGRGIQRLQEAGVRVRLGLLAAEATRLNEYFLKYIQTGRPFVLLKMAMSLDGKIATRTRESQWITGEEARRRVQELRNEVDAVLVGIDTVLADDPQLTVRLPGLDDRQPLRVVVDSAARLPLHARIIAPTTAGQTLLFTGAAASPEKVQALRAHGVEVITLEDVSSRIPLGPVMDTLGKREIMSLMIEGGAEVAAAAVEEGLVDKVVFFVAPRLIGGRDAPSLLGGRGVASLSQAWRVHRLEIERLGSDLLISGYLTEGERSGVHRDH